VPLLLFAEVLGHLEMVLESWKRLTGPVLQFEILTALGIALEKRHRILVSTNLHEIEFRGEIVRLRIFQFVDFAPSRAVGIAALASAGAMDFSSCDVLV
jgi:hypothetical protein